MQTQTMVQGYPLCRGSLQGLLDRLGPFLAQVENKLAGCKVRDEGVGLESVAEEFPPSSAFEELIAVSSFALQMMPADAAPSIVLVVDGVFDMGVAAVAEHDDVVMQLCRDDIVLSVLCIAPLREPNTALGYVGDVVALENVVKTTKGCLMGAMNGGQKVAVLANCSSSEGPRYTLACGGKKDPQYLRECILLRDSRLSFSLDVKAARVKRDSDLSASALPKPLPSTLSSPAAKRLELKKYCLPLMCLQMLLELRIAEGFHMTAFRVASSPKVMWEARSLSDRDNDSSAKREDKDKERRSGARGVLVDDTSSRGVSLSMRRFYDRNTVLEYHLDYVPQTSVFDRNMGAARIDIDLVGNRNLEFLFTDNLCCQSDASMQPMWRFVQGLEDTDFHLFNTMIQLKAGDEVSRASRDRKRARRKRKGHPYNDLILYLGKLPLQDWTRYLHVRLFDLVTVDEERITCKVDKNDDEAAGTGIDHSRHRERMGNCKSYGWVGDQHCRRADRSDGHGEKGSSGDELEPCSHAREDLLRTLLGRWCTFPAGRYLFVKCFSHAGYVTKRRQRQLCFALVKLAWASDHLVRIYMGFFGLHGEAASKQVMELQRAITSADGLIILVEEPVVSQTQLFIRSHGHRNKLPGCPTLTGKVVRSALRYKQWKWRIGHYTHPLLVMDTLRRAHTTAGFRLVQQEPGYILLIKHVVLIVRPVLGFEDVMDTYRHQAEETQGARCKRGLFIAHDVKGTVARTRSALLQYRVFVQAPYGLVTELFMEPQEGFGSLMDHRGKLSDVKLWEKLVAHCYEQNRRLISALDSFLYIRHLCSEAHPGLDSTGRRKEGFPPTCTPQEFNMLEILRGASRTELALELFLPLRANKSAHSICSSDLPQKGEENDIVENDRHLYLLTEESLRTLLGTEIPVDLFNVPLQDESVAARKARRQGENLLWNVELGLTDWREGKCFAHQLLDNVLSIWFLAPYGYLNALRQDTGNMKCSGIVSDSKRPKLVIKIFVIDFQQMIKHMVTGALALRDSPCGPPLSTSAPATNSQSHLPLDTPLLAYISYLHRRNFTQVAYMALRRGHPVAPPDLEDALGYCSEIGMDVDMTQLRKIALVTRKTKIKPLTGRHAAAEFKGCTLTGGDQMGGTRAAGEKAAQMESEKDKDARTTDGSLALGPNADREFQEAIASWLTPVPGTDFYFYIGPEADLHEEGCGEVDSVTTRGELTEECEESNVAPPKIYMRKASNANGSVSKSVILSPCEQSKDHLKRVACHSANSQGIEGLFQQGYEAELGMMLKMLDVKRKAQARNRSGSTTDGMASLRADVNSVTPCFVRFEAVHALYGLAQSRVFRLTSATPPSTILPFCFDEAVVREDVWVPARVSRQASSMSIICATHSRLDVAKFEAALDHARQIKDCHGNIPCTGSLSEEEAKDLMLTTHKRFLRLVRRRIEAWTAAQTLKCLSSLLPLTTLAAPTILQCLRALSADAVTRVNLTLAFVAIFSDDAREADYSSDDAHPGENPKPTMSAGKAWRKTRTHFDKKHAEAIGTISGDDNDKILASQSIEEREKEALDLFHDHLSGDRFLPVRKVGEIYILVRPYNPCQVSPSQTGRSFTTSSTSSPNLTYKPPAEQFCHRKKNSSVGSFGKSAYEIPYWVVLQVQRKKVPGGKMTSTTTGVPEKSRTRNLGGAIMGDHWSDDFSLESYLDSHEVVISMHHPVSAPWYEARNEIMEDVERGIWNACKHVNQILLLRHLHDTHHASSFLIAPCDNDQRPYEMDSARIAQSREGGVSPSSAARTFNYPVHSSDYSSVRGHKGQNQGEMCYAYKGNTTDCEIMAPLQHRREPPFPFYPDQFKCPRKLTLRFPVFHRLTSFAALRALEADVLHPLTVQNRAHTFVHRDRNGRVSYLRFEASQWKDSMASSGHGSTIYGKIGETNFGLDLDSSAHSGSGGVISAQPVGAISVEDLAAQSTAASSTLSGGTVAWIDCHVHGVEDAGEEISCHLRRLLESRLAEISIFHLSELLSRNPRLQLTKQDLDLIKRGTTTISPGAAVAAMGGSPVISVPSNSAPSMLPETCKPGGSYRAFLKLPGALLNYGDAYLFLLYLRQNTARAQFINNLHVVSSNHGSSNNNLADSYVAQFVPSMSLSDRGLYRPARSQSPHPSCNESSSNIDIRDFGSGRHLEGVYETWAPENADASNWHPARIGYSGPRLVEPLDAATSHPALWSMAGGCEVEISQGLLNLYYNHNRPELYDAGRKDVATTLSSRGARLAKEVGKGLALVNLQPVDAFGNNVRRLPSAVPVTQGEIDAITMAAYNCDRESLLTDELLPWATSIQTSHEDTETSFDASQTPPLGHGNVCSRNCSASPPASFSPPLSNSSSLPWFQRLDSNMNSNSPSPGDLYAGVGVAGNRTSPGNGLWGISVEILGSVNGEPLTQWLKLCVDQALHDYFIERLLAFLKIQPKSQSERGKSSSGHLSAKKTMDNSTDEAKSFGGRAGQILAPWDQLVTNSIRLDSPSIRQQEGSEIIHFAELTSIVQLMCLAFGQAHPFLQSTLMVLREPSSAGLDRVNTRLDLLDQASLILNEESQGAAQYTLFGGLRVEDAPAFYHTESVGGTAKPASFNNRKTINASKSAEILPPADSLYPTLTASEGATASMNALRMTNRDTACVVRITADSQKLVLYNCHPELASRLIAVFEQVLALAAFSRVVAEGVALQKLGLLSQHWQWWRLSPVLSVLGEKVEKQKIKEDSTGTCQVYSGAISVDAPSKLAFSSNRGTCTVDDQDDVSSFSTRTAQHEGVSHTLTSMGNVQRAISNDHNKSIGPLPGGRSGADIVGDGNVRGAKVQSGTVVTPAMAARLRASRLGFSTSLMRGKKYPAFGKPFDASGPSPSASSNGDMAGKHLESSIAQVLTTSTSTSSDVLEKHTASTFVPSGSERPMLRASTDPCRSSDFPASTKENDLLFKLEHMRAALKVNWSQYVMDANRRLSLLLRPINAEIWTLIPSRIDDASKASSCGSSSPCTNEGVLSRLKQLMGSTQMFLGFLESGARLREACSTWTWYHHHLILEQRSASLRSKLNRPRNVNLNKSIPAYDKGNLADTAASQHKTNKSMEKIQEAVTILEFEAVLKHARWHASSCAVLRESLSYQTPFSVGGTSRKESDAKSKQDEDCLAPSLLDKKSSSSPGPSSREAMIWENERVTALGRVITPEGQHRQPSGTLSHDFSSSLSSPASCLPVLEIKHASSATPVLESPTSKTYSVVARRFQSSPVQIEEKCPEAQESEINHKDNVEGYLPALNDGPRHVTASSTISTLPHITPELSRTSTNLDDHSLLSNVSTVYSNCNDTNQGTEEFRRDAQLLEGEKEDFLFAKGFLDHYSYFLQHSLKMTRLMLSEPAFTSTGFCEKEDDNSGSLPCWSSLKAFFHRFVALTNTITIVKIQCERRPISRNMESTTQVHDSLHLCVKVSLFTLNLYQCEFLNMAHSEPSGFSSSCATKYLSREKLRSRWSLPTTDSFLWSMQGYESDNKVGAPHNVQHQRSHGHLQLPQDVALSISQLKLEAQVYDYLVGHLMQSLLAKGSRNEERQSRRNDITGNSFDSCDLHSLKQLLDKNQEPPSHSQTAIGVRHISFLRYETLFKHCWGQKGEEQTVYVENAEICEHLCSCESPGHQRSHVDMPDSVDLLQHMQTYHDHYDLWPLQEMDGEGRVINAVVGAVSPNTLLPLHLVTKGCDEVSETGREIGDTLLFVLTTSPRLQNEHNASALLVYILHQKGREQHQRGFCMEIPDYVESLLDRILKAAFFNYEKDHVWAHIGESLEVKELMTKPKERNEAGTVIMNRTGVVAPSPLVASSAPLSTDAVEAKDGSANGRSWQATCEPLVFATTAAFPNQDFSFPSCYLNMLYRFSAASLPLEELDPRLIALLSTQEDLGIPWLDFVTYLEHDPYWYRHVVRVKGTQGEGKGVDLLLCCNGDDFTRRDGGKIAPQSGGLPSVQCLLHLSLRHENLFLSDRPAQRHNVMARIILRDNTQESMTDMQKRHVETCVRTILGWAWLVLARSGST